MNKKIALGISLTLLACLIPVSIGLTVYFTNQANNPSQQPENNTTPSISQANTEFSANYQKNYNISMPVMFLVNRENQNGTSILNGTSWIFDKRIDQFSDLTTYYLMTNLHVINVWANEDKQNPINPNAIKSLMFFIGDKDAKKPFEQNNMLTPNNEPYFKWKYITAQHSIFFNDWYASSMIQSFPALDMNNETLQQPNRLLELNQYTANRLGIRLNGIQGFQLIPLSLGGANSLNQDVGLIRVDLKKNSTLLTNPKSPFYHYEQLIKDKQPSEIFNFSGLSQNQKIDVSVGGYPAMKDTINNLYSTWNAATKQAVIKYGNNNRGAILFQDVYGSTANSWYGDAYSLNLFPGSSGSVVINNQTGLIEGIYWGGVQQRNSNNFYGRFVPFANNHVFGFWNEMVKANQIQTFLTSTSINKQLKDFISSANNIDSFINKNIVLYFYDKLW